MHGVHRGSLFAGSFHGGTGCGTVICVTAFASAAEHFVPRYERRGSCGGSTQQSQELRWQRNDRWRFAHGTSRPRAGYLVNGHPATAKEEQVLRSYGFAAGAWRMNGWGISLDTEHADFVSEPRLPQCHYVLDVPLDCGEMQIASR